MGGHRDKKQEYLRGTCTFVSSFKMLEYDDAFIELYENFPCSSREELRRREGEVIREFGERCINKVIAGRTHKEYYQDNKEIFNEKAKIYYKDNIDKIKERNKKYYEDNKDIKKEYRENNKDKIKEKNKKYYEDNKDKVKEQKKEYYENNKDKLKKQKKEYNEKNKDKRKEKNSEKIRCECGLFIAYGWLSRHKKTEKHKQNLEK
jgi:hypothetical protein